MASILKHVQRRCSPLHEGPRMAETPAAAALLIGYCKQPTQSSLRTRPHPAAPTPGPSNVSSPLHRGEAWKPAAQTPAAPAEAPAAGPVQRRSTGRPSTPCAAVQKAVLD